MLSRRRFLGWITPLGVAAIAPGVNACGTAAPTPPPPAPAAVQPSPAPAAPVSAPSASSPVANLASVAVRRKAGGELIAAVANDPTTLDPARAGVIAGRTATRAVHNALFAVNEQGRLQPELAERWEQPDDRTFVITLRQGVKFHDGTNLDAEAVKYNLERVRNPATASIRAGEISTIDTIDVINANTVKFTLKRPFAAALFPLIDVAGMIGSPTAMERWGDQYGQHPVGTGPFKFVEYQKDTQTVLEKNPDYWEKDKPYLDRLVLRPIPTDSTRLTDLRAGSVQIAEALPLQDVQRLRDNPDLVISEKVGFRWEYFGWSVKPQYPSANLKFRQAFQWAIDREALHQTVYAGTGSIGYDGILPGSPFFDGAYQPFSHDMAKAKRLMEESGVTLPVTLPMLTVNDPVAQRRAQIFQATAAELGVHMEIVQVDYASWSQRLAAGDYALDVQGWWGYRPDPDQYLFTLLHSTGSYAKYAGYANPKMDELIEAERAARTEPERRQVFRQIADLMAEEAVYIAWHYGSDFKGLSPKVQGFVHFQDSIIRYQDISLG